MDVFLGLLITGGILWFVGWVLYRLFLTLWRGFQHLTRPFGSTRTALSQRPEHPKVVPYAKTPTQREETHIETTEYIVGEANSTRGYVIPERSGHASEEVVDAMRFEVNVSYYGPGSGFLEDANRYVGRTNGKSPHVPFKTYWSTYQDMNRQQAAWYFYWRDQLRRDKSLPTDLSYIFIHIYECLHLIGFDSAEKALAHLKRVWITYRQAHPSLDNYLQHWLLDMVAYFDVDADPLTLVEEMLDNGVRISERDLAIAPWLRSKSFDALDLGLMTTLANFDPRSGKFYREFADKPSIERSYQIAFRAVDAYYRETMGKALFEEYLDKQPIRIKRQAFAGAVFQYPSREIVVAEVPHLVNSQKLQALLESTLKFTENILRRQAGFRGSRRGIELPSELEENLAQALAPIEETAPQRTLTIDLERVQNLKAESSAIRAQLIEEDAGGVRQAYSERFDLPADVPPGQLTDVDRVADVLDHLSTPALTFLYDLKAQSWESQNLQPGNVQEIHQTSNTYLGESLIERETDRWVVAEDYRDELAFLLSLEAYAKPREAGDSSIPVSSPSLDADWSVLRSHLTPLHLQALTKICGGCDPSVLESFAAEHFTMKDLLIEEINEYAMTALGDNIIDPYADPLTVYDEHHANVSALVNA